MNLLYRNIVFLFLVFPILFWGQKNVNQFKHLSAADGLSQSSVIAIEQDRLGQIWLGTRDGLNRYDGSKFKIFRNDPNDSTSISNSDILSIKEDRDGNIWVGTYNGLNCYNPLTNTFKRYLHSDAENSLCNNTVWCITETKNGEIWVGTSNGLSIYDRTKDEFINFSTSKEDDIRLPSNFVASILETKEGFIWVGTSKGLCKLERTSSEGFAFQNYGTEEVEYFIQDIKKCGKDTLCLGTKNKGLLRFDTVSGTFFTKSEKNDLNSFEDDVRALTFDATGKLWLGTSNGVRIISEDGAITKITHNPNRPESLSNNYIKSLFTDKKGSVWIGSYYGGVDLWDESNTNFINYTHTSSRNNIGLKVVSSIVADKAKNRYLGTEGNGITILDTDGRLIRNLNHENSPALLSNNIKSLLINSDKLWIGSFNKGAFVYDMKKQRFDERSLTEKLREYLAETGVYSIKRSSEKTLWLGTFGKGLVRYQLSAGKIEAFTVNTNKPLSSNRIRSLLIDSSENIWAGTQSGLNKLNFDSSNDSLKSVQFFFFNLETQSGADILSLFEDSGKTIWASIRGKGLYRFDGQGFESVKLSPDKKITSVHAILEDQDRNLWMSSNQGIIKYDPKANKSTIYDQKDGLIQNEFNSGSALKVGNTEFYFGGPFGVSYFDIENLSLNAYAPQVLLTDIKIKNESVSPGGPDNILYENIAFTNSITLPYDKANFSIAFSIPNFINPGSNRYSYRMVGLENDWNETDLTQVNYTIQNPGTYIFEIKGSNNDGIWNSKPTALEIIVEPAPWKSGWAFMGYALIIALALIGLTRIIRSKTRLRHQLELEHFKSERNKEIHNTKLQFFTNISHEFRTPLTLISGPLQQLLENYNGSSFMYKKLLVIESNANHLLQLINRLMDFRKFENEQFKLKAAEGNIVKFLREIFLSFSEFAKDGGYNYTFHASSEKILMYYDRVKLEQVFYNLISNAFKYTPKNGTISVAVVELNGKARIDIEDSGTGIPNEFKEKIFDRFFEVESGKTRDDHLQKGTGIGLSIAKKMVNLHHGNLCIIPKKGQGSIFRTELSLGSQHLSDSEIWSEFKFSDDLALYTSQLKRPLEKTNTAIEIFKPDEEKETILVVEDNLPLREFITDLLSQEYNVLEAANGKEAFKKALRYVPDLIVSDVIMPEMVGTELCAQIKSNIKTSHIPVILLTSRTSLVYKFEGLGNGANDYVSKPFDLKEFLLRVRNLIASTRRLKKKFTEKDGFVPSEVTVSSIDEKLLEKALHIVENNISNEQFDITSFSEQLGVSRSLLFTKIKAWTNSTPNGFIQEIRMKRALQLLEQNTLNISEISYKVGFKNPKYFSKLFQKRYGEAPSRYLQKFSDDFVKLS